MLKELPVFLLAAAISIPVQARADYDSQPNEHMTVTGIRNPLPGRAIGASIIVLERVDLEKKGAHTVSEALRGLPGITLRRSGGAGSNAEIMIRGDRGGHTMVMIDGVEQADVASIEKNFDLGEMPLHDVERIEIIKGPHSVAYGGSGLSGVIHVITRRPLQGVSGAYGLDLGSHDSYGAHARVAGRQGAWGYSAIVADQRTGGFSHAEAGKNAERDAFKRMDGSMRLQYGSEGVYSADLMVKGSQAVSDVDAGAYADDPNFQVKRRELMSQLAQKLRMQNGHETRLAIGITQSDRRIFDDPDPGNPSRDQTWDRSRYEGERRSADFNQLIKITSGHDLLLAIQWLHDAADIRSRASYQGYAVDDKSPKETVEETSYALQHQWEFGERVQGQWGVRTLRNSAFDQTTVGQAAFQFVLLPDLTGMRLNYGRGFKTPSLYHLRAPVYGNRDLQPEAMITAEAALEQKLSDGVTASVTGFQNEMTNLIELNETSFQYYNISRASIRGVESRLEGLLSPNINAAIQYTHITSLDRKSGSPLPSRPDDSWSGDVSWMQDRFNWTASLRGQSRSRAHPYAHGTRGFRVLDTNLSWTFAAARYALKVNNVLNSWYQEVAGYNTTARSFLVNAEFSL